MIPSQASPHVDHYDVFLVQTSGSREWEVALGGIISVDDEFSNLVEASEVGILNITQSIDCLYHVPPRVMHCAVGRPRRMTALRLVSVLSGTLF
jgi:ribosomal protein L16 Arg81 hydroxylase